MELVRRTSGRNHGPLAAFLSAAVGAGPQAEAEAPAPHGLTVWGDTVRVGSHVRANVFRRTEAVVFRAEVEYDGSVRPDAVVAVRVGGGEALPMPYDAHARPGAPHFLSAPWPVALNQRPGRVGYTISATDPATGAVASWSPFPTPRSVLTITPYAYSVTITATVVGHAVKVSATVTRPIRLEGGQTGAMPLAAGGATAAIGFEGTLGPDGILRGLRSSRLAYNADLSAWTGLIGTAGLGPGLYVVQVRAQDLVATPNVGIGNSYPFHLTRGA